MSDDDIWNEITQVTRAGFIASTYCCDADLCTEIAVNAIHQAFAGQRLGYMPKKRKSTSKAILSAAAKSDVATVANAFGVSRQTVYNEIRRRALRIR